MIGAMRALALVLLLPGAVMAADWTATDTTLLGSALALTAIDWGQTRYMAKTMYTEKWNFDGTPAVSARSHYETNPLLGREPRLKTIDRYFPAAMLGTAVLSVVMPTTYRRTFLGGVILLESAVVLRNHQIGLRVSF
jgi:hypothetical protein